MRWWRCQKPEIRYSELRTTIVQFKTAIIFDLGFPASSPNFAECRTSWLKRGARCHLTLVVQARVCNVTPTPLKSTYFLNGKIYNNALFPGMFWLQNGIFADTLCVSRSPIWLLKHDVISGKDCTYWCWLLELAETKFQQLDPLAYDTDVFITMH